MTALNPSDKRKQVGLDTFTQKPPVMSIFDFSAEALRELWTWFLQNPVPTPVTQIIGFQQFTVSVNVDNTQVSENGTSASSTPALANLPDGQYVIVWGCQCYSSVAGTAAEMGVSLNGSAIDPGLVAANAGTTAVSVVSFTAQTLQNNGSNSISSIYQGGTGTFSNRALLALKYANP